MEVHAELCCLPTAGKWKRGRGRKQERLRREGEERNGKKEGGRKRKRSNGGKGGSESEAEQQKLDTFSLLHHIPDKSQLEGSVGLGS